MVPPTRRRPDRGAWLDGLWARLNLRAYFGPGGTQAGDLAKLIASHEPDVVLLQEARPKWLDVVCRAAGGGERQFCVGVSVIVVLWRAGLRIGEALSLSETDMDARRGAVLVRHGKGDKRREVGMDSWAWEQLEPWQQVRVRFPARGWAGCRR